MNSLTVKEYDRISIKSLQDQGLSEEHAKKIFNDLKEFKIKFDRKNETTLMSIGYSSNIGDYISFKQYIGLIQFEEGFQIEILPKIYMGNNDATLKKIVLKMIKSLTKANSYNSSLSNLDLLKMNMLDIYLYLFLNSVSELLKRGLKSNYISVEDNLNTLKGKLILNKNIRKNICHQEKFYCQFDDYNFNRVENRILKTALLKVNRIAKSNNNKKLCGRLLPYFDNIDESINYNADFEQIVLDRNNNEYNDSLKMAKIILNNISYSIYSGSSNNYSLLFDMNDLFESYVAQQIKHIFSDKFDVETQSKDYHLFEDPKSFLLKPDIVIRDRTPSRKLTILDTKWKVLYDNKTCLSISQADMYQMYTYSHKYKYKEMINDIPEVWLLYPKCDTCLKTIAKQDGATNNISQITTFIDNYNGKKDVIIRIFFIDLLNIENNLKQLKNLIQ